VGSGTSYAAPHVAGAAARLIEAARAAGADASPDRIEGLLKDCARQHPLFPYTLQGFGFFHRPELSTALIHASTAETCDDPTAFFNGAQRDAGRLYAPVLPEAMRFVMTRIADCDLLFVC